MAYGLAPSFANQLLGTIGGTSFTPPAATWAQLHTGDPGLNGTANISSTTARQVATWNAPAGGVMTMSNTPSWGNWAGTSPEVLVGISIWTLAAAGTFLFSFQLTANITVQTGFPTSLSSQVVTIGQLAA